MAEPRDGWAKLDILAKVLTPVIIFGLGTWYNVNQGKQAEAQKVSDRIVSLVKSLSSDKVQERKAALALIQYEKSKHPNDVPDELIAIALPVLIETARNDPNPEVAQEANQIAKDVSQSADKTLAASVQRQVDTIQPRVYVHIRNENQRGPAKQIEQKLEAIGFNVPGIQRLDAAPSNTEMRYFRQDDKQDAEKMISLLQEQGVIDAQAKYVPGNENSRAMRPKHFELWFSANSLRPSAEATSQQQAR
ncbi:MAG: hypothetical protein ABIU20_01190 [Blastocatellia bacterium]